MIAEKGPLGAPHSGPAPGASPFQDGDGHYTSPAIVALLLVFFNRTEAGYFPKELSSVQREMIMKITYRGHKPHRGHRMAEGPKHGLWDWTTWQAPKLSGPQLPHL